MICKNCDTVNEDNALKCIECNVMLDGSMISAREKVYDLEHDEVLCKNCQTKNPISAMKCSNCNLSLVGSMVIANKEWSLKSNQVVPDVSPIQMETKIKENTSEENACHKCGYPNRPGATVCVQCGATLNLGNFFIKKPSETPQMIVETPKVETPQVEVAKESPIIENVEVKIEPQITETRKEEIVVPDLPQEIGTATINPWATKQRSGFKLTPMNVDESSTISEMFFAGTEAILNRGNLDTNNQTISSQKHATIKKEGSQWYISDHSSQKATFIRVSENSKLEDGDIILIGNVLYRFKTE